MKIYSLECVQLLPISVDEAWAFFSTPKNLSVITPPEMKFVIHTKLTDEPIYSGMEIDYTVRPMLGIPMRWRTVITGVNAPHVFTDMQERGPYSLWQHTHTFEAVPGGVRMTDVVEYALPLGVLGVIMHSLIIENKLKEIFKFRETKLNQLFGEYIAK
jgi:ligand-binding SRPBCC domain-containing protein